MEHDIPLHKAIEAILFYRGEPVSFSELSKLLKLHEEGIREEVAKLRDRLADSGLSLVETGDAVTLATSADTSELITKLRKEELSRDLSKATLETLSIILYGDLVTRADIDFIRGVNSSFIVRNLLVRGLVERTTHPTDNRKIVYAPTADLLTYMGVGKIEDIPEYTAVREKLQAAKEGAAMPEEINA